MQIDIVAPAQLTPQDMAAWRALQATNPACASPYLSPDWALAVAAVDGPDRDGARVVVLREAGQAVGFLPLRLGRATARPLGAPMCDYQGLVSAPDLKVDPRAIVRALGVARLDFTHLLADQRPFAPFMQGTSLSQLVDLSGGYDTYAAERREGGSGLLKDIGKKLRKMEREEGPVEFVLSDSREEFDQLIALKRAQYKLTRQTDIFDAGWPLELLGNLFESREPGFGGVLFALRLNGKAIALNFCLRTPQVLHCWFIAHDRAFDRFSPGVILMDQILRWQSAQGIGEFDMGPGDYLFKLRLANTTRTVAHGFVGAPSAHALVRGAQYGVRRLAETLPLGRVSALPGKAMRRLDVVSGLKA